MSVKRTLGLIAALILIAGGVWALESRKVKGPGQDVSADISAVDITETAEMKAEKYERAKEIVDSAGFINTDPLVIQDLIGKKVILVDFWTYSCINCQRTMPYLNSWYEKYKDQGLEIVGIHTPEFEFEKKFENVSRAVKKFNIKYPVVLDNNYATWSAYRNRYWPRKYLIDIDGFIVYDHIGEGAYVETEKKIQELLKERALALNKDEKIDSDIADPSSAMNVDSSSIGSPEIYFGAWRNEYLANGLQGLLGVQSLKAPQEIEFNSLYLTGDWNFAKQYAVNKNGQTRIIFKYKAKDVYMVARAESGVNLTILRDGEVVDEEAGEDVRNGKVFVKEDRLYKLISDPQGYGIHTLEIIIEEPGFEAFTFTFG